MSDDSIIIIILAISAGIASLISAITSIVTVNIRLKNSNEDRKKTQENLMQQYVTHSNLIDKLEIVQIKLDNIVEHLKRLDNQLNNKKGEK